MEASSTVATVAFLVFAVVAAVDWVAVHLGERRVEHVAHPPRFVAIERTR